MFALFHSELLRDMYGCNLQKHWQLAQKMTAHFCFCRDKQLKIV